MLLNPEERAKAVQHLAVLYSSGGGPVVGADPPEPDNAGDMVVEEEGEDGPMEAEEEEHITTTTTSSDKLQQHPTHRSVAHLLSRRHIEHWRGMNCFTSRILKLLSVNKRDAAVRHGCATVHRWWEAEGRFLGQRALTTREERVHAAASHFRIRPANRLTAGLPLVYTNLPESHPIHAHVVNRCVSGIPSVTSSTGTGPVPLLAANTGRAILNRRVNVMSVPPAEAPHRRRNDDPADLWRAFTRRFPVLAVYQPVWCDTEAASLLQQSSSGSASTTHNNSSLTDVARTLRWPLDMAQREDAVRLLAQQMFPDQPWAQWDAAGQ